MQLKYLLNSPSIEEGKKDTVEASILGFKVARLTMVNKTAEVKKVSETNSIDGTLPSSPAADPHQASDVHSSAAKSANKDDSVIPWEEELRLRPGVDYAPDILQWLVDRTPLNGVWKWDHVTLKEALVGCGLMNEVRFYMAPSQQSLFAVWTFGKQMVGHPSIVHGGAIAFAFDESFGILFASLSMGPGYTAHLGVDYRKPFPATTSACLEATVDYIERRKVFFQGYFKK